MFSSLGRCVVSASVATFVSSVTPSLALAMDMQCRCYSGTKSAVDGKSSKVDGTTYNFKCKATYSTLGSDTNTDDYNKYVKIYYSDGSSGDKSVALKIRPRTSKCLESVYDSNKKKLWGGAYCDTSDEKKFEPFPMKYSTGDTPDGTAGAQYTVGGAAVAGSIENRLIGIYLLDSSGKYNIIAGCVED